jgi:hypothetical protein
LYHISDYGLFTWLVGQNLQAAKFRPGRKSKLTRTCSIALSDTNMTFFPASTIASGTPNSDFDTKSIFGVPGYLVRYSLSLSNEKYDQHIVKDEGIPKG